MWEKWKANCTNRWRRRWSHRMVGENLTIWLSIKIRKKLDQAQQSLERLISTRNNAKSTRCHSATSTATTYGYLSQPTWIEAEASMFFKTWTRYTSWSSSTARVKSSSLPRNKKRKLRILRKRTVVTQPVKTYSLPSKSHLRQVRTKLNLTTSSFRSTSKDLY